MTHPNRSKRVVRTVNGVKVSHTRIFRSGGFWRWKIVDERGREYLDGGNYLSKEQATEGLSAALDQKKA